MIDCHEAVRRMWLYLEQALEAPRTDELEQHLDTCTRCCGELEFNRNLRQMVGEREGVPPMPASVRDRIEILLGKAEPETEAPR